MADTYFQCILHQSRAVDILEEGVDSALVILVHTAWLPARFSKVGSLLLIDKMEGLWRVVEKGASREYGDIKNYERDYLDQREASDI